MRAILIAASLTFATLASAALPPPGDAAKAKAAEAAAKAAWSSKVAAFQLCGAQNRVAQRYHDSSAKSGDRAAPQPLPPCVDPGPFGAQAAAAKPEEAAGAHSPAETAAAPPTEQQPGAGASAPPPSHVAVRHVRQAITGRPRQSAPRCAARRSTPRFRRQS